MVVVVRRSARVVGCSSLVDRRGESWFELLSSVVEVPEPKKWFTILVKEGEFLVGLRESVFSL